LPANAREQLRSEHSNPFAAKGFTAIVLSGWHGNLVTLKRLQCVLLAHNTTRFPVFIPAMRKHDFATFDYRFADSTINTLLKPGIDDELKDLAVSQLAPILIAKTGDRSVLGTLNNMIQQIQFAIENGEIGTLLPLSEMHPKMRSRFGPD
jgi:hypothetical protein